MVDARRLSPGRGVARHHRVHRDRTCAPGKRCVTGRAGDGPHVRAAFVPIIGAVFAGVMAVLVALVTGGVVSAAIVGVVAIVVQQLDNDILAPWVYGRALTGPPPRRDPRERRRRRGAVRHRWHAAVPVVAVAVSVTLASRMPALRMQAVSCDSKARSCDTLCEGI